MEGTDPWDAFAADLTGEPVAPSLPLTGGTPPVATSSPALEALCVQWERVSVEQARITEQLKDIEASIAEQLYLPSDAVDEEITVTLKVGSVTAARGERWSWDQDILGSLVGTAVGPLVEQKLSIPKKKFEALPSAEQATFLPALTRKPGPLKITVARS